MPDDRRFLIVDHDELVAELSDPIDRNRVSNPSIVIDPKVTPPCAPVFARLGQFEQRYGRAHRPVLWHLMNSDPCDDWPCIPDNDGGYCVKVNTIRGFGFAGTAALMPEVEAYFKGTTHA